jgi:NADH-quinone oxidoreductase subunit L
MFFACGVSAYGAGIFHLMTHAFFKALLFLGSGSVIHAMSGEQDMRKMGGIGGKIPLTRALMWVGSLALAGVPFFAGYYSKDSIIESAFAAQTGAGEYAFWLGVAAAVLTAFYSWRLLLMTFEGPSRADAHTLAHVHESPKSMIVPLLVLAAGAICAGFIGFDYFVGEHAATFWGKALLVLPSHPALAQSEHVAGWVKFIPTVVGLFGIALAFYMYLLRPDLPAAVAARIRPIYLFVYNKWYFDELYDWLFVRPAQRLGRALWQQGDGTMIDGLGPDGIAAVTQGLARISSRLQTGYVYHYAFAIVIGVAGLVSYYLFIYRVG